LQALASTLDEAELSDLKDQFDAIDVDKNGSISLEEMRQVKVLFHIQLGLLSLSLSLSLSPSLSLSLSQTMSMSDTTRSGSKTEPLKPVCYNAMK
jgi:Ca2+-binding EF-hand superfamily protein